MARVGRKGSNYGLGIAGLRQREVGDISPRNFAHLAAASEDLVLRLGIHKKLNRHRGCVNTVTFNEDGDILVSGSDDRMVILWDWDRGKVKLAFHSCHSNNIFQARFMPYTNDRSIVTCAADGEVRHAQLMEGGQVGIMMLGKHYGRAHKLAVEPGSSHIFYSCGEDGVVQHFDLRTKSATQLFVCKSSVRKSTFRPSICLNAIAIDPRNANLFAVAGSDAYVQLYDIRKYKWDGTKDFGQPTDCFCPEHLIGELGREVTGLAFSDQSELLASYTDEFIYLFSRDQGLGPHPSPSSQGSSMNVETGSDSDEVCGSPSITMTAESVPQVYKGHRNSDTVKGVTFFGPSSEYVVSGSDCGRIFIWRKKDGELLRVMEGDKHVVNCIEPHPHAATLASSGFEHDIKIWIPNATERAPPVNMEEVMMADGIDYFDLDDSDYDDDDDDDDDDGPDADDFDCDYFDDVDDFLDDDDFGGDFDDGPINDVEMCNGHNNTTNDVPC